MITNEFKRVKSNSHRLGGKKKPNQLDGTEVGTIRGWKNWKKLRDFSPHENAERVIYLVFAGTTIQEATSMTSRRENLTSLREKDRSNLTTMIFFFFAELDWETTKRKRLFYLGGLVNNPGILKSKQASQYTRGKVSGMGKPIRETTGSQKESGKSMN